MRDMNQQKGRSCYSSSFFRGGSPDFRPVKSPTLPPPLLCRQSQPVYPGLSPCGFRQPYSSNLTGAASYSRYRSPAPPPAGRGTSLPPPHRRPESGRSSNRVAMCFWLLSVCRVQLLSASIRPFSTTTRRCCTHTHTHTRVASGPLCPRSGNLCVRPCGFFCSSRTFSGGGPASRREPQGLPPRLCAFRSLVGACNQNPSALPAGLSCTPGQRSPPHNLEVR